MKRDILCKACEEVHRTLFPTESPYPGEYVKFIYGEAKKKMTCDCCAMTIKKGDNCCAFSVYTDDRPYLTWEEDYIKPTNKKSI